MDESSLYVGAMLDSISKLGHKRINEDHCEEFVRGKKIVKTLKAIRTALNNDSDQGFDSGTVALSSIRAITQHIIPLVMTCQDDENDPESPQILREVTKLLVLLTMPSNTSNFENHVRELRLAFIQNPIAFVILLSQLENALATDSSKRTEDDKLLVELILWLVRNLIGPQPSSEDLHRDELIILLEKENVLEVILHFTEHISRKNNREWDLLLLEIYFNLFRNVTPEHLQPDFREKSQKNTTKSSFRGVAENKNYSKQTSRTHVPTRHSQFGGLFQSDQHLEKKIISSIYNENLPKKMEGLTRSINQRKRRVQDTSAISQSVFATSSTSLQTLEVLKRVADVLIDTSYGTLFSCIIQDFRREDARLVPQDEVHFLWLIRFFSRYTRFTKRDWSKVSATMDLWSFQFVVNRVIEHLEVKAWVSLETSVGTLLEMMLNLKETRKQGNDEEKRLKNAVFYELRERLEIIPKLLKVWDPATTSTQHLKNLAMLGDLILETVEQMAEEGAMAKAQSKAMRKKERESKGVFHLTWSAEETSAIAEGVKARGGDYNEQIMKSILKDSALGPVFEEEKRTAKQLLARWIQVRQALALGKTLEQFIREDAMQQEEQDKKDEQEEEEEKEEGEQKFEKQIDFIAELRNYLSNNVYRNLSKLIDPILWEDHASFVKDVETHRLVAKYFRRLRAFSKGLRPGESLEPMLWHIENFSSWNRALEVIGKDSIELIRVIESSLRHFFRHAEKNEFIFSEILFWRTKQDNVLLSRGYEQRASSRQQHTVMYAQEQDEEEYREPSPSDKTDYDDDDDDEEEYDQDEEYGDVAKERKPENEEDQEKKERKEKKLQKEQQKLEEKKKRLELVRIREQEEEEREKRRQEIKEKKKKSKEQEQIENQVILKIDQENLNKCVFSAIKFGLSDSINALVHAFENHASPLTEVPFVHSNSGEFKKRLWHVMLILGMRPPGRIVSNKEKDLFSYEKYWRLPCLTMEQLNDCAQSIRDAISTSEKSAEIWEEREEDEQEDDLVWCETDEEEEKEKSSDEDSSSDDDEPEPEEEEKNTEETSKVMKKRRIVEDDDD